MATGSPTFYTVAEAAELLRVSSASIYRAVRQDAFPAVRFQGRVIIPAKAVEQMVEQAVTSGRCVDIAELMTARRDERVGEEVRRRGW